jgi:hypothetical protein
MKKAAHMEDLARRPAGGAGKPQETPTRAQQGISFWVIAVYKTPCELDDLLLFLLVPKKAAGGRGTQTRPEGDNPRRRAEGK